jgi:hypothetical protein
MTQLSRNLSGASLASAKKARRDHHDVPVARRFDTEVPSTSFARPAAAAFDGTPVMRKAVPVKYSQGTMTVATEQL